MGKLFTLALEDANKGFVYRSELDAIDLQDDQPILNETELESNTEEATTLQSEIENDEYQVDQAIEEANQLAEQIVANDEKLNNPDETITVADIVTSEESLTRACYTLGIHNSFKLSFANESLREDMLLQPKKYLNISNENSDNTLREIVDKIIIFIKNMVTKLIAFIQRVIFKIGNYVGRFVNNVKKLKDYKNQLEVNPSDEIANKVKEQLESMETAGSRYTLLHNGEINTYYVDGANVVHGLVGIHDFYLKYIKEIRQSAKTGKELVLKDFSGIGSYNNKNILKEYGYKNIEDFIVVAPPSGDSALVFKSIDHTSLFDVNFKHPKFKTVKLEKEDLKSNFTTNGVNRLYKVITADSTVNYVKKTNQYSKEMMGEIKKIQQDADKSIKEFKHNDNGIINADPGYIRQAMQFKQYLANLADTTKSVAVTASMYYTNAYFATIKYAIKLSSILLKSVDLNHKDQAGDIKALPKPEPEEYEAEIVED